MGVPKDNPGGQMNHRGAVGVMNLYSSCILMVPWSSKWFTGLSRVNPGIPLLSKRFQRIYMKFSGIIKYYHASKMLKFNSNVSSVYTLRQFLDFVQGVFQKSLKINFLCLCIYHFNLDKRLKFYFRYFRFKPKEF